MPGRVMLRRVTDPTLAAWGWDDDLASRAGELLASPRGAPPRRVGRAVTEDRLGLVLQTSRGEVRAVVPGKLRRAAASGEAAKPVVGDWVVVEDRPGQDGLPVLGVVPRRTKLSRKAAGRDAVEQVVGANVDVAFLVTSIDADLSPRRLQRYRAICEEGGVRPVVVLTKVDLAPDAPARVAEIEAAVPSIPVHLVSNVTGAGLDALDALLVPGTTTALVGSSGVGKSTLINRWIGDRQVTGAVRDDGKGRHTTTHRALFLTPMGGVVMDNPGMRELGLWEADEGLRATFEDVERLAASCRFTDCTHENEPGCAIREALAEGRLDPARFESWRTLRDELAEMDRKRATRGTADERRAHKAMARALRERLRAKGR